MLKNRVHEMRKQHGWSMQELADRCTPQATASQINKLEKGKTQLSFAWIDRIAKAFGCRDIDLLEDTNGEHDAPSIAAPASQAGDYTAIPVFESPVAAGQGVSSDPGSIVNHNQFRTEWLQTVSDSNLDKLAIVTVAGDSMEPTLRAGDSVLVDRGKNHPYKDGIYVLDGVSGLQVKHVFRHLQDETVSVESDNKIYPSWPDIDPATIDWFGRVIWLGRCV